MRKVYVYHNGEIVEKSKVMQERNTPYIIQDTIEPYLNHATGEMVDSRTRHKQILRQHGLVEVGNEDMSKHVKKPDPHRNDDVKRDIARALKDYGR